MSKEPQESVQSFEQAREELAGIVTALEAGGLSLEESLELWERGEKAAAVCSTWLDQAREKLDQAIESTQAQGDANGSEDDEG